jgi:hypothetical protein
VGKESKSVVVTVADHALDDIDGVAKRLKAHGMSVTRVMAKTGVISGSVHAAKLSSLKGVSGVESVEEELSAYPTEG